MNTMTRNIAVRFNVTLEQASEIQDILNGYHHIHFGNSSKRAIERAMDEAHEEWMAA